MAVEFRYASPSEYPQLAKCLNDYWAVNHIYVRSEPLFQWTFNRADVWEHDSLSFSVAEDKGEMVGILGGIPFWFNNRGQRSKGVWIANYVIRPDYRKGTFALQLLSQFRKPEFDPVIAFGINPATVSIYKVLRGEVLPDIPRHFLVLPGAAARVERLMSLAYPDADSGEHAAIVKHFELTSSPAVNSSGARELPGDWDEARWKALAAETVGVARDRAYLKWRYQDHPLFEYRFLSLEDGLLVWRLETIRKAVDGRREDVDRIGRLVEFLPSSTQNAKQLFAALLSELEANGAVGADYYGYHGPTGRLFDELGFRRALSHSCGAKLPSRFQPLDGKDGGIMSAMFISQKAAPCNTAADCPWYWTKSDSDQDRPN
ncbi:MAG: hypothetical protein IT168_33000 [Bryobacterales bacterium]|nr:hypothetical protein [Bryobacterales bacterium]